MWSRLHEWGKLPPERGVRQGVMDAKPIMALQSSPYLVQSVWDFSPPAHLNTYRSGARGCGDWWQIIIIGLPLGYPTTHIELFGVDIFTNYKRKWNIHLLWWLITRPWKTLSCHPFLSINIANCNNKITSTQHHSFTDCTLRNAVLVRVYGYEKFITLK